MSPTLNSAAISHYAAATSVTAPPQTPPPPRLEAVEFSDFVFLLAELWGLVVDDIRQHWVFGLFGAGLGERAREVGAIICVCMCVCVHGVCVCVNVQAYCSIFVSWGMEFPGEPLGICVPQGTKFPGGPSIATCRCLPVPCISFLFQSPPTSPPSQAFLSIEDKCRASQELLSLAGYLGDHLLHSLQSKTERLALLAQATPSLLEWLRKQVRTKELLDCRTMLERLCGVFW